MAEKFQDNSTSWADRLESLEQVPGETAFDRSAAWQQLQARLDRTPAGKRRFPYWMVAAALILVALGFYWWPEKKTVPGNIPETPVVAPLFCHNTCYSTCTRSGWHSPEKHKKDRATNTSQKV